MRFPFQIQTDLPRYRENLPCLNREIARSTSGNILGCLLAIGPWVCGIWSVGSGLNPQTAPFPKIPNVIRLIRKIPVLTLGSQHKAYKQSRTGSRTRPNIRQTGTCVPLRFPSLRLGVGPEIFVSINLRSGSPPPCSPQAACVEANAQYLRMSFTERVVLRMKLASSCSLKCDVTDTVLVSRLQKLLWVYEILWPERHPLESGNVLVNNQH